MNVIFLDIDGVLVSPGDRHIVYECASREKLKILKKIVRKTDALVVVISSRRYYQNERENIKRAFKNKVSFISEIFTKLSRYEEIIEYVSKNDVKGFLIIDDNEYDYKKDPVTSRRFVETITDIGLTKEHVKECINKMKIKL